MSDLFDLPFEEDEPEPALDPARIEAPPPPLERDTASHGGPVLRGEGSKAGSEPQAPSPQPRRVLSVTELTVRVRDLLEAEFFEVWVEGELSNCRVWNT
jgi:hypothetical protein